jgi:carboxyl-terminal processing protease
VRSFGKGSVQNLMDLPGKAEMKLTVAHYYLPNGESLHRSDRSVTWGVEPEVHVYLTPEQVGGLLKAKRDSEIIKGKGGDAAPVATTQSTTQKAQEPVYDTQLDTALLLMRLQLLQQKS